MVLCYVRVLTSPESSSPVPLALPAVSNSCAAASRCRWEMGRLRSAYIRHQRLWRLFKQPVSSAWGMPADSSHVAKCWGSDDVNVAFSLT